MDFPCPTGTGTEGAQSAAGSSIGFGFLARCCWQRRHPAAPPQPLTTTAHLKGLSELVLLGARAQHIGHELAEELGICKTQRQRREPQWSGPQTGQQQQW